MRVDVCATWYVIWYGLRKTVMKHSHANAYLVGHVADVENNGTTRHLQQRGVDREKLLEVTNNSNTPLQTYLFTSKVSLQDVWLKQPSHVHSRGVMGGVL